MTLIGSEPPGWGQIPLAALGGPERPSTPRTPPSVTGAWNPAEPGQRKFHRIAERQPFRLEMGGELHQIDIAYETWGTLSPSRDNAILVCHALSGDSHARGRTGPGHPSSGWWDTVIGPGRPLDTDRFHVVCANVLGGCQGTTGPASLHPDDGEPYGPRFPVVTIRDMVRVQAALADHLEISKWHLVIGGSMGGMQVLEWGVTYPGRCRALMPIATAPSATAQQIAYSSIQRHAIALDPAWNQGNYYDAEPGGGPHRGLALARALAHVTYRSDQVFNDRFGRTLVERLEDGPWARFNVEGYLDHQCRKFVERFDANSYLVIAKAMDLHDVGRRPGGAAGALSRIRCPVRTMSITSDALYPTYQQHLVCDVLDSMGADVEDISIDSPEGHDSFLIDTDQVGTAISNLLDYIDSLP